MHARAGLFYEIGKVHLHFGAFHPTARIWQRWVGLFSDMKKWLHPATHQKSVRSSFGFLNKCQQVRRDVKPKRASVERGYCTQPTRNVRPEHAVLCALYLKSPRSAAAVALERIEENLTAYDCTNQLFVLLPMHGILSHSACWGQSAATHVTATPTTLTEAYAVMSSICT